MITAARAVSVRAKMAPGNRLGINSLAERRFRRRSRHIFTRNTPAAHVKNAVSVEIDLIDLVRDQEDGHTAPGQAADDLVYSLLIPDVHADRRTVENQNFRFRRKPLREYNALLVTAGEC